MREHNAGVAMFQNEVQCLWQRRAASWVVLGSVHQYGEQAFPARFRFHVIAPAERVLLHADLGDHRDAVFVSVSIGLPKHALCQKDDLAALVPYK